jgi:predicted HTH domain antitoxin
VARMYELGHISSGRAAELAGMSRLTAVPLFVA